MTREMTHGERLVANCLTQLNLEFKREVKFKAYNYRYDFYVPSKRVMIEFDGEQHFQQVAKYQPSYEDFKNQQKRDVIKTRLAISKGFRIIRLTYTTLDANADIILDRLRLALMSRNKLMYIHRYDSGQVHLRDNAIIYKWLTSRVLPH